MSSSDIMTPSKLSFDRRIPFIMTVESEAGISSRSGYTACEVMIQTGCCAAMSLNGTRSVLNISAGFPSIRGSLRWESSVPPPSPGKCLRQGITPERRYPPAEAVPSRLTCSGVLEKIRFFFISGFRSALSSRLTSRTTPRLTW